MRPVRTEMADIVAGFRAMHQAAFKAGALSVAEKELIALSIGVALRCENCIYSHVQASLKAGATREQVLEAAGVAVLMQGGPSYTYLPQVIEALDALAAHAAATK
ncbi:MAG: carboxymuconolactone decarboxylase family protein [Acidobacteriota bacterium]|nr:carboxymuconolactone decarboxylase family protein [Acidobacteriota bacterium]